MRSQISMISAMLWSISSTPAPCSSRTERTSCGEVGNLRLGQAGRRLVEQHEARLGRERARDAEPPLVAVRERRRGRVGVAREPEPLEQPSARAAASRGPAPTPSADDLDVLAHRQRRGSRALCWNVRASPCRPRRCGVQRVTSRPPSSTVPLVGPVEAAEDVDERRLAGAVRADQADDLAAVRARASTPRAPGRPRTSARRRRPGVFLRASSPTACRRSSRHSDLRDDLGDDRADELRHVVLDLDHAVLTGRTRCAASARS